MPQNVVGARALKTRFGSYLRQVQGGPRLVVAECGRPVVAELRPITAEAGTDAVLAELEARRAAARRSRAGLSPVRLIDALGTHLSEAVVSDRDDRS